MSDILTTKPGDKYASIRNPRQYRALRRRGYSKESAAKITNARSKSIDDLERAVETDQPQYLIDAIAALVPELPRLKGEQIAPGITRIRGNLCNVHGRYGKCPGVSVAPTKPPPAKPGKGGRARKPVKPPKEKDPATVARQEQRDREHTEDRTQRQQDRQERMTRQAARDAERLRKEQEQLNKPAKGGGGGGAKPKPTDDDKRAAQTQERTQRASETAATVGLGAADVSNLRAAAEGGALTGDAAGLARLGFVQDGEATDQGRRALSALERGDVRQYRAAVQDAQARMGREQAAAGRRAETEQRRTEAERTRQQRQTETERRRTEADQRRAARDEEKRTEPDRKRAVRRARRDAARNETRMQKAFQVYKQANGAYRWVAFSSNAYRDRDKEIVSTKALADDCARADQDGSYGPLRWWHVPGVELGTCDFNAMHGRILVESGTFKDATIGARIAAKANQLQLSIGFVHPPNEPDANGVFHNIRRFERSLVPRGRASNPFTKITVKEPTMASLKEAWGSFVSLFDGDEQQAKQYALAAETAQKEADEVNTAYKEAESQTIVLNGVTYAKVAEKAPLPPPAEEEVPAAEVELQADDMAPMMEEEPAGGLTLSPEDLTAITEVFTTAIQAALAPVVGMLDIEKKVAGHVQSMLQPYQTQKDTSDAERATQIAALTATVEAQQTALKEAQAQLAELIGEQPAALKAGYRATSDFQTIVGAERKKDLTPPAQTDLDPIVAQLMGNGVNIPGN